jgi:hypothetical protein
MEILKHNERTGSQFILMLRSFEASTFEIRLNPEDLTEGLKGWAETELDRRRRYLKPGAKEEIGFRFVSTESLDEERVGLALSETLPVVAISNPSDPSAIHDEIPRLSLDPEEWKAQVRRLIAIAPLIMVRVSTLTPSVRFELEAILAEGRQESSLVLLCKPASGRPLLQKASALLRTDIPVETRLSPDDPLLSQFNRVVREEDIEYASLSESPMIRAWLGL